MIVKILDASPVKCPCLGGVSTAWTLRLCPEEGNLTNTTTLLDYATSTTTTTKTTTTSRDLTKTLASGGAPTVVGFSTTLTPAVVMMMSSTTTLAEAAASAVVWFVSCHKLVLLPYIYSHVIKSLSLWYVANDKTIEWRDFPINKEIF